MVILQCKYERFSNSLQCYKPILLICVYIKMLDIILGLYFSWGYICGRLANCLGA